MWYNFTKKALAASLKKLLEQKPFAKITVTDITEDGEVNRHTFYYHTVRDSAWLMSYTFNRQPHLKSRPISSL